MKPLMKPLWMGMLIVTGMVFLWKSVGADPAAPAPAPAPKEKWFDLQVTPLGLAYEIDRHSGEVWCIALDEKILVNEHNGSGAFRTALMQLQGFNQASNLHLSELQAAKQNKP